MRSELRKLLERTANGGYGNLLDHKVDQVMGVMKKQPLWRRILNRYE